MLNEFNHQCAVCGAAKPQLHHIDEDPSNNDPLNLIPLCPNHHLTVQHNPTVALDAGILRLFREFKDPAILAPQFQPIYSRLRFLFLAETDPVSVDPRRQFRELIEFVSALHMGISYAKQIRAGLTLKSSPVPLSPAEKAKMDEENCRRLAEDRGRIVKLLVEILRFQDWAPPSKRSDS